MYGIWFGILYSGYSCLFFDISKYLALSAATFQEVKEGNMRRYSCENFQRMQKENQNYVNFYCVKTH